MTGVDRLYSCFRFAIASRPLSSKTRTVASIALAGRYCCDEEGTVNKIQSLKWGSDV